MIPLVPLLLEQFVGEDGVDLSVIDDCLRARPAANHCLFGRSKTFSSTNWLKQHPLALIVTANYPPVYDHDVVRICVDLKFQLFANFLYLSILIVQILYVFLYTTVALTSPTPTDSYYDVTNYTCKQLCTKLRSNSIDPLPVNVLLRKRISIKRFLNLVLNSFRLEMLRYLLLLCSCLGLLKELFQVLSQRQKYFREMFINFLEVQTYVCGILFSIDVNHCTQVTGLRCKWQWESGALGIASVWTLLLFVFMNALKIGKYGLLFVSVLLNFLKFCLIYVFIWIGYIIAFHMLFIHQSPQFTYIFYAIPKTVAMLTGEYDFDDLFFPNGRVLYGSQAAMVLFSIFVFTMNIVIMNIMVGLAVADVKSFRLNAKREHLRARIETCLGLQAKFGLLCETCSRLVLALSRQTYLSNYRFYNLTKYHLWKLELRTIHIHLPRSYTENPSSVNRPIKYNNNPNRDVLCETGYYRQHIDRNGEQLLQESDYQRLTHRLEEIRDGFEKANGRVHHELRKLILSLQSDFDEIKRKLLTD